MATRRWLKIGAGVAGGVTTIISLFVLLSLNFGFIITDLTGDIFCEGTYENPCISEFTVRNPTSANVDIYSKDQVKLDFSPGIQDWALFVPDGRCGATGKCACDLKNGERIGFEDWRCVDFTNKTKPRQDKVYNFRFERYSTTTFRLAGVKNDPKDKIKWSFETSDAELDPVWFPKGETNDGGGIINPQVHKYFIPIGESTNEFDMRYDKDQIYLTPLNESVNLNSLKFRVATSKETLNRNQGLEIAQKKSGSDDYVIDLNRKRRYFEFGEGPNTWVIKSSANLFCGEVCVTEFEIDANKDGSEINITFIPKMEDYILEYDNNGIWENIEGFEGKHSFEMKAGNVYNFRLTLNKELKQDVKWNVKALGEFLDPTFYGDNPLIAVTGHSTNNYPEYYNGTWAGDSWTAQAIVQDVGADTKNLIFAQHPSKEEMLLIWGDSVSALQTIFWNATLWYSYNEIDFDLFSPGTYHGYDVVAESVSGDYFVAYVHDANVDDEDLQYRIWNGTGWSANADYEGCDGLGDRDTASYIEAVKTAANPINDEILVAWNDVDDNLMTAMWDGDSFGDCSLLTAFLAQVSAGDPSTGEPMVPFEVVWYQDGSKAFVFFAETTDDLSVIEWDESTQRFGAVKTLLTTELGAIPQWMTVVSSPFKNKLRGGIYDDTNDIWMFELDSNNDVQNLTEIIAAYGNYPFYSVAISIPAENRFLYGVSNAFDTLLINDSYNSADLVVISTQDAMSFKFATSTKDGLVGIIYIDDLFEASAGVWNATSGVFTGQTALENSVEERWSSAIAINAYPGIPNLSLNILDPTTASPADVSSDLDFTIQVNITLNGVPLSTIIPIVNNITVDGIEVTIRNTTATIGIWETRTDDDGDTSTGNPDSVTFTTFGHTNYVALATPLTDDDVPYSLAILNKVATGFDVKIEDDLGADEVANFMYAAINKTHTIIDETYHIECGNTSLFASSHIITFATDFPDNDYAMICNPNDDSDTPICILKDTITKATTGFTAFTNDDAGSTESVPGIQWCAFSIGEYTIDTVNVKVGQDTQASSVLTGVFDTAFPDTNYIVLITDATSYVSDGCSCEVTARNTGSFTAVCEDDGDSAGNCNSETFDWVAITKGDFDSQINQTTDQIWFANSIWNLNVTAPSGLSGLKDLFVNLTVGQVLVDTETSAVNYGVAVDTCTPPGSGVWDLLCSDNCSYSTEQQVPGNVSITDSGNITFFSGGIWNFTNPDSYVFVSKSTLLCEIFTYSGGGWNL